MCHSDAREFDAPNSLVRQKEGVQGEGEKEAGVQRKEEGQGRRMRREVKGRKRVVGKEVCDVGAMWLLLYGERANPINLLIFERGGRGGILQCDAVVIKMSNIKQVRVYAELEINFKHLNRR